jgi:hypothetical protein
MVAKEGGVLKTKAIKQYLFLHSNHVKKKTV